MHNDVVDLREFYLSPLGQTVRRILRARLNRIWPNPGNERILALGYGTPVLRPWIGNAKLIAMMPAAQGVAYWPREGPNISALVEMDKLPLPDDSIDRVILMHVIEGTGDLHGLLREIWRVMKSGGRMLAIVPNRRGLWAHSDRTPFGTGQPYSSFQIKDTLRDHGFLVDRTFRALYAPPSQSRFLLPLADSFEKFGEIICPGFSGLLLMEAGKQIYAPIAAKKKLSPHRLVLPLPLPGHPLPTGRMQELP